MAKRRKNNMIMLLVRKLCEIVVLLVLFLFVSISLVTMGDAD